MSTDEELNALRKRVEELERAAEPRAERPRPQPIDWTQGMSMDGSAIRAMAAVVGDRGMAEIVREQSRPVALPSVAGEPVRGSGWVEQKPLTPPAGVEWCDRLMDAQDARDRAERLAKLGRKDEQQS